MFIFPFNPPGDSGSRLSPLCLLNPLSPRFQSLCLCFRASSLGHFGVSRLCCSDYRNQKLGVAKKVAGGLAIPDPLAQDEAGATSFTARPRSFPDPPAAPHCHPRVGLLNRCSPPSSSPPQSHSSTSLRSRCQCHESVGQCCQCRAALPRSGCSCGCSKQNLHNQGCFGAILGAPVRKITANPRRGFGRVGYCGRHVEGHRRMTRMNTNGRAEGKVNALPHSQGLNQAWHCLSASSRG